MEGTYLSCSFLWLSLFILCESEWAHSGPTRVNYPGPPVEPAAGENGYYDVGDTTDYRDEIEDVPSVAEVVLKRKKNTGLNGGRDCVLCC